MMKKFFTKSWFKAACVAILGLMSVSASAEESETISLNGYQSGDDKVVEGNYVTVVYTAYDWKADFYYPGDHITFTAKEGYVISQITLGNVVNWNGNVIQDGEGNTCGSFNSSTYTWTGNSDVVSFVRNALTWQDTYVSNATVWVVPVGDDDAEPTLANINYSSVIKNQDKKSFSSDVLTLDKDVTIYDANKHITVDGNVVNSEVVSNNTLTISFDEVATLGTHTIVVPEGMIQVGKFINNEISYTFEVVDYDKATFDFTAYSERAVTLGEVLSSDDPNITMSFSETTSQTKIVRRGGNHVLQTAGTFAISAAEGYVITDIFFNGYGGTSSSYTAQNIQLTSNSTGVYDNHYNVNYGMYGEDSEWTGSANSVEFESTYDYGMSVSSIIVKYVPATSADVTVSAGYATYYNATKAYVMPADCEGYVFSAANGLELAYVAGAVVPADEPLILKAAQGTYTLDYSDETGTKFAGQNDLRGASANMTAAEMSAANPGKTKFYALSLNAASDPSSIGFYWINEGGAAFDMPAGKAYLALSAAAAGENRGWSFAEMENGLETAISLTPSLSESEGACYDLYGRRTNGKGLMIQNGKVVLVK